MVRGIVVGGQKIDLIDAPTTGDVVITHEGVATIGSGKVTLDMLDPDIHKYLLPVAVVGEGKVGYCVVAP